MAYRITPLVLTADDHDDILLMKISQREREIKEYEIAISTAEAVLKSPEYASLDQVTPRHLESVVSGPDAEIARLYQHRDQLRREMEFNEGELQKCNGYHEGLVRQLTGSRLGAALERMNQKGE